MASSLFERANEEYCQKLCTMKLSIIVPVYNVDKYLERCLDSLKLMGIFQDTCLHCRLEQSCLVSSYTISDNTLHSPFQIKN